MKFLLATIPFILLSTTSIAQPKAENINWCVAATLPPATKTDKQLGVAGPLAGVHNGVLMVGGGANFPQAMPWLGGKKMYYRDVYLFKKGAKGNLNFLQQVLLPEAVGYSANCSTPIGVVSAGGENEAGITNKVWLLQWNGTTLKIEDLPPLPQGLTNAMLTYSDGCIYLAGGETAIEATRHFLYLDLNHLANGWLPLPQLPQPTTHGVLVVQEDGDGKSIYLLGGRSKTNSGISKLYNNVYAFNLAKKVWEEKASLPYALSAGTGAAAVKHSILLFGGDKGETFHQTEKLIAAINAEKDATKKKALNQQKIKLQSSHPGFSREVLTYDTQKNQWSKVGTIPYEAPVTTTAVKWDDAIYIPSGEVKAGVRTPQILKGEIKLNDKKGSKGF